MSHSYNVKITFRNLQKINSEGLFVKRLGSSYSHKHILWDTFDSIFFLVENRIKGWRKAKKYESLSSAHDIKCC